MKGSQIFSGWKWDLQPKQVKNHCSTWKKTKTFVTASDLIHEYMQYNITEFRSKVIIKTYQTEHPNILSFNNFDDCPKII